MPLTVDKIVGKTANSDRAGDIRLNFIYERVSLVPESKANVFVPIKVSDDIRIVGAEVRTSNGAIAFQRVYITHFLTSLFCPGLRPGLPHYRGLMPPSLCV